MLLFYLLLSFILSTFIFPIPPWDRVVYLLRKIISNRYRAGIGFSLFKYVCSTSIYYLVHVIVLPLDLLIACFCFVFNRNVMSPVFICGTPRSGSTLLHRSIIDSSSRFYGFSHFEWRFPSVTLQILASISGLKKWISIKNYWGNTPYSDVVSKMHKAKLGDHEEDAILFEERCCHHPYVYLHAPFDDIISASWFTRRKGSFSNFFSIESRMARVYLLVIFSLSILKGRNKNFISKEVASNDKLSLINSLFPRSKFIIITRHPSCYLSSLRPLLELSTNSKVYPDTFVCNAKWWDSWYQWLVRQADSVADFYAHLNVLQPHRVLHIKYEDLVSNPRDELMTIAKFLGSIEINSLENVILSLEHSRMHRVRGYDYEMLEFNQKDFVKFEHTFHYT